MQLWKVTQIKAVLTIELEILRIRFCPGYWKKCIDMLSWFLLCSIIWKRYYMLYNIWYKYYNTKDNGKKKCTAWTNAYQALIVFYSLYISIIFKKWLQWVGNAWTAYILEPLIFHYSMVYLPLSILECNHYGMVVPTL